MAQPDSYWAETSDTQTLPLNAEGTIACFVDFIKTKKDDWGQAIQACKAK